MSKRIKRTAAAFAAAGVMAASGITLATSASAAFYGNTTTYGNIKSDSNCSNVAAGYCSIRFTNTSTVARPRSYSENVSNCSRWGIPDGTPIIEAIASGKLNNKYVGVLYGGTGAEGALNCH